MAETLVDHQVCAGEARLGVAIGSRESRARRCRATLVHARRRSHRGLGRHQRGQRLVVHGDELQGVGQPGGIVGDRDGYGLAHVADDPAGQDLLGERPALVGTPVRRGDGRRDAPAGPPPSTPRPRPGPPGRRSEAPATTRA